MSDFEIWAVIFGLTAVTVATRSFFLALGDRIALPERLQHGLRFAPACALAALVAPEALTAGGAPALSLDNFRLLAAAAAVLTMLATRSMVATIAVGMVVFTALRLYA